MAYYNWRGTGSVARFPYAVNDRAYLSTPVFSWQQLQPPMRYNNAQLDAMFNGWARTSWTHERLRASWDGIENAVLRKIRSLQEFYFPPAFLLATLAAWRSLLRSRKALFLFAACASTTASLFPVVWFQRHYAAPMTAAAFGLGILAMRYIRRWTWSGRPVGIGLSRALASFCLLLFPLSIRDAYSPVGKTIKTDCRMSSCARARLESQLEALPGEHLVLVRYAAGHNPFDEWVFNRAGIDGAKVVWAREIPGRDMQPLLDYFRNRRVWLVQPDKAPQPLRELQGDAKQKLAEEAAPSLP